MAAWEPQPEGLQTIVQLLTEFRQPGANQAQARAPEPHAPPPAAHGAARRRSSLAWSSAARCPTSTTTWPTCSAAPRCVLLPLRPCCAAGLTPSAPQTQPLEVRQSAGLLLKNNVRRGWSSLNPAVQAYVKARHAPASPRPS